MYSVPNDSGQLQFSSPFIEERLYLEQQIFIQEWMDAVLVPFYRGAVVFFMDSAQIKSLAQFSSPFIEERLYLKST